MKHALIVLWFCLALKLAAGPAAELPWHTDLATAQAQANREKKSVLLFFHGSDWCPLCKEMQRQVFQSPEFIAYARQALVLVDVDFPEKTNQSPELKRANLALKARYNVGDNFPCLVLLGESGETVFQETGYAGGGPKEVISKLQRHAQPPAATGSTPFQSANVGEFARLAADKQNAILDVRTGQEFQGGHLAGAIHLDVSAPDFAARAGALDRDKTYLVYCASGVRSVRACEKLVQLNFSKLYNLSGGYRAWVKAGQPVEK
jgi:rhodanese-related sulfurtransferase/thioredoxin-related protein